MKKTTILSFGTAVVAAALISFVGYGCGDDDTAASPKPDSGTSSSGGSSSGSTSDAGDSGAKPAPPTLGAQIDRMGRPGVNTALNKTFTDDATRAAAEDAYNADKDKTGWVAKYKGDFAASLAIYDGVDTTCGNQAFASGDAGAQNSAAEKYGTLASVLADDRLWLDTSATTCAQYLGVELNATGAVPNTDCGGRTLAYDVIDTTYTALATTLGSPVGDNVAKVDAKTNGTAFPYLSAPQ